MVGMMVRDTSSNVAVLPWSDMMGGSEGGDSGVAGKPLFPELGYLLRVQDDFARHDAVSAGFPRGSTRTAFGCCDNLLLSLT